MISTTHADGRGEDRTAGIVRGTIGVSEDGRPWVRTAGGDTDGRYSQRRRGTG